MSTAQIAVLGRNRIELSGLDQTPVRSSRGVTLTAFMFLALYGAMRWGTMLSGSPAGRLFGLLALTLLIAWLGGHIAATRLWARVVAAVGILLAALAMIPVSGFPLRWLVDLRIAVLARSISHGLSALPHVIVPYSGHQVATGGVIVLGAGMLMLAAALALCTTHGRVGQARLVAAAVPLIVLAIVPSVLAEPRLASIHGVILFLGLMAFLFSERVAPRRVAGAMTFALLAAVLALILSPAVETSRAWIDVKTIGASRLRFGERFNWAQTYGPLDWPRQGSDVMSVQARFPSYWKAEDLDLFNGSGWVSSLVGEGSALAGVSRASLARWTEPLTITLSAMSTTDVIAAGVASPPRSNAMIVIPGNAPGTWQSERQLGPNTSYQVDVYSPRPTGAELAAAPARYPMGVLAPELQLILPISPRTQRLTGDASGQVQFEPFGSHYRLEPSGGLNRADESLIVRNSPYAPVSRLAARLRADASTPYAYVEAVLRYLGDGFTYDQDTHRGPDPLLTFLFKTHQGYCQQFAGSMALLLRMGGIPARVATGFTTGTYDAQTHSYVVSDLGAHAWVEAWFAGYGWVTFDPTPDADPALSGTPSLPAVQSSSATYRGPGSAHRARRAGAAAPKGPRHRGQASGRSTGGVSALAILVAVLIALALGLAGLLWRAPRTPEAYVEELDRAFTRSRHPPAPEVTLAGLERRFADSPDAAQYMRALSQARFAGQPTLPSAEQRRAARRRLGRELGPLGWAWAFIALPPLAGRRGPRLH